ncbi:alpha/beta hydrolase, partial [bacterium]|nr:alpha/beta hydrolase [bacterium]
EAAREPKTFLEIQGGHNEGWAQSGEGYRQGIDAFVTACLAGGGQER